MSIEDASRELVYKWAYVASMRNQTLLQSVELRELCAELLTWVTGQETE